MTSKQRRIAERPHQIVECVAEFIKDGDLNGIITMFHPDCKIAMDPTQKPLEGHDAVKAIFADLVEKRANLIGEVTGELINGDTAILQGNWSLEDGDVTVIGGGASTEVAKKLSNGGWVYFIDCPISLPAPEK